MVPEQHRVTTYDMLGRLIYSGIADTENTDLDSGNTKVGVTNPLRYRSYYYDTEVGRFISADAAEFTAMSTVMLDDTNLFAYCGNDPVNNIDASGSFFNTIPHPRSSAPRR